MANVWIDKAHKYLIDHRSFTNVSDILKGTNDAFVITADILIDLPAKFQGKGITESGVRSVELITFIFNDDFPLKAPKILLREDFPRSFPHINPSTEEVLPCIYEGDLSELLQQNAWLNGILNQLVDWMEKAASGSLMNYEQGWEPMRCDITSGFIIYDKKETLEYIKNNHIGSRVIYYQENNNFILTDELCIPGESKPSTVFICRSRNFHIIKNYCPSKINNLAELYQYAQSIGLKDLRNRVESYDLQHIDEDKLFIILALKRPAKLIGSDSDIELLNFIVHKAPTRKEKKRVLPECKVGMLSHINRATPALLKQLSGTKQILDQQKEIAMLGCGSLGSKIGLHLVRSGNGPFVYIDHDFFLPHNNARYGFSIPNVINKAELLSLVTLTISGKEAKFYKSSGMHADYSKCRVIIDSTASLSVRSFLMSKRDLPPIVSCMLFGGGSLGITFVEGRDKKTELDDLWAHLYLHALESEWLRAVLFSNQHGQLMIGQSCSTLTVVMSDASLSMFASTMALKIQKVLDEGFPAHGEIMLSRINENYSLLSEKITVPNCCLVPSLTPKSWRVRISDYAFKKMTEQSLTAGVNETGGCLLGTVFLNANSIIVTDILLPPPDSQSSPSMFILGTEGLEQKIKTIERKTDGKVTYLGSWHSHPHGGSASHTDKNTAMKLIFVRDYEPTVCIIWTPRGLMQI